MNINLSWAEFKIIAATREKIRYVDRETFYLIYYKDDGGIFETSIEQDAGADCVDFETNYKASANKKSEVVKDSDGATLQRIKVTTTGWHYQLHGIEFKTSQLNSLNSKKEDGTDFGFTTIKCYNAANEELTEQSNCDLYAVKTVVDWEPTHDIEIIGGSFKQKSMPSSDIRMWVVGAPDVAAEYGGSKLFAANLNLIYMGLEEGVHVDGRAPKYLTYNTAYHTSKLRIILKHDAGVKHDMHIIFELFKA